MRFDHVAQRVPDVGAAVAWYLAVIPDSRVRYQDDTWALVEAGGVKLAFVVPEQHPDHLAWRVDAEELERLAAHHAVPIATHRDRTRSIYIPGPGMAVEIITYPEDSPTSD